MRFLIASDKCCVPVGPRLDRLVTLSRADQFSLNGIDERTVHTVSCHFLAQLVGRVERIASVVAVADTDVCVEYGNAR